MLPFRHATSNPFNLLLNCPVRAVKPALTWVPAGSKGYREFTTDRAYMGGIVLSSSTSGMTVSRSATGYDLTTKTQFAANTFRRTSAGLLIEPSDTNQLNYSTDLSNAGGWTNGNANGTTNRVTGPDGVASTGTVITVSNGNAGFYRALPNLNTWTLCIFLRAQSGTPQVRLENGFYQIGSVFTLSTTWARYSVSGTNTSGNQNYYELRTDGPTQIPSVTIEVAYAQAINRLNSPVSYIASGSSAGSRDADVITDITPTGANQALLRYSDNSTSTSTGLTAGSSWTLPTNYTGVTLVSLDYR